MRPIPEPPYQPFLHLSGFKEILGGFSTRVQKQLNNFRLCFFYCLPSGKTPLPSFPTRYYQVGKSGVFKQIGKQHGSYIHQPNCPNFSGLFGSLAIVKLILFYVYPQLHKMLIQEDQRGCSNIKYVCNAGKRKNTRSSVIIT